jgi:hypothetical protein
VQGEGLHIASLFNDPIAFAVRTPWVLHVADLHVTLDLRPLRGYRGSSSQYYSEEQKLLHDFTSLSVDGPAEFPGPLSVPSSVRSDTTSSVASPTAARTGALSSINISS